MKEKLAKYKIPLLRVNFGIRFHLWYGFNTSLCPPKIYMLKLPFSQISLDTQMKMITSEWLRVILEFLEK